MSTSPGSTASPAAGAAPRPDRVLQRRRRWRRAPTALVFAGPSVVLFALFVFYPLYRIADLGRYETDFFGGNETYVGWERYRDVLTSDELRHTLWVTAQYALFTVPTGLVLGVALAVLADKQLRGIRIFRTIFSSTVATSVAVAALMWLVLLQPSIGLLPEILPFDALRTPGLLGRDSTALPAVALTSVWRNLGFMFIVVSAGLQSIPPELYESARVDGARAWRQFWEITVPMLGPTLAFGFVVLSIGAFQSFGEIDLLTSGGPNDRTQVLVYSIYQNAFGAGADRGKGAVLSVALFGVVVVLSLVQVSFFDRRVHRGG